MINHYIKIALRNMSRQKMYALVKIGGFAIGIAACLMIALLVKNELSYDTQYKNADDIYRLIGVFNNSGKIEKGVSFPAPMAKAILKDFPEIQNAGRIMPNNLFNGAGSNQFRRGDKVDNTYEDGFCFADQEVLDILDIKMVYGERKHALTQPFSLVISKRKADKYFPGENPVGKTVYLNDMKQPITIGGVMENFPTTSHLQYDFFISLAGVRFWDGEQETWNASNYSIYVLLRPGINIPSFERKITEDILKNYVVPNMQKQGSTDIDKVLKSAHVMMQPIKDVHLKSYDIDDWEPRGDQRFVWLFSAIACFILLIACINFINLSTARSANRAKEVGLRKVIGSQRRSLISQFLTESILYSFLSFVIAIVLAWFLLPFFNRIAGKQLSIDWTAWWLLPVLIVSATFIGFLAGLYPSFYLSSFRPISVLKGKLSKGSKNSGLRGALVVFQFTTSMILLIGTLVIYRQMKYISSTKLGFDKDQVVMIQGTKTLGEKTASLKNELLKLPQVKNVSVSDFLPVSNTKRNGNTFWKEGKTREESGVPGQHWTIDDDYISTMGMKITSGRNFSKEMKSDSQAVIINQKMAKELGYADPFGKMITNGWQHFIVIGIVEDFHFASLKYSIEPLCMTLGNSNDVVSVKVKGGNINESLGQISSVWKSFSPHQSMRYIFLDESFAAMHKDVERTSLIFTSFSVLAIIVACLGLFALASFMAEQRSKEISIRKVLGASVSGLFALLTGNFLKLILISLVIAVPAGWWMMQKWLQDFSYRISIQWWVFAQAGVIVLFIALFTVSYQAIRAALLNPMNSLRSDPRSHAAPAAPAGPASAFCASGFSAGAGRAATTPRPPSGFAGSCFSA